MGASSLIKVPQGGAKIIPGKPMPDNPIIPYIEGDGIGVDITPVMIKVVDAAVAKAYGGKKKIHWMEVYAGEKSTRLYGGDVWLPAETLETLKEYSVSIKGPMTTPVGGGIRSLNVALRQELDLYQCVRPVRYFKGVPSPLKDPSKVDRSAAYAARYVAKNIVAAGLARKCLVQISYAIGIARPTSVMVTTQGTGRIGDDRLAALVSKHFDLRPRGIVQMLDLLRPIYQKTASYGHFGRDDPEFSWERTDRAAALRADAG